MTLRHLLNCQECDWYEVVEGPFMLADVKREQHGDSIRNWRKDREALCDMDSIAWVSLKEESEVTPKQ